MGVLIGFARLNENNEKLITKDTDRLVIEALFTTITNINFNNKTILAIIEKIKIEKARLVPNCLCCFSSCDRNDNYDTNKIWEADEDIRSLKSLILFGIRGVAACAYYASVPGYGDSDIN